MVGFWNLGDGATPLAFLAHWLCGTTPAFTALGTGIGSLLGLAFPWHIGSAALMAGELWPGTQELGLVLIPAILFGLTARRRTWQATTLIGARSISSCTCWAWEPNNANELLEMDLDMTSAITTKSRETALIAQLPKYGTVWQGENTVNLQDRAALTRWCGYAIQIQRELFVGALERNNWPTIRRFVPDECHADVIYERRVGLPEIPGGIGIGAGQFEEVTIGNRSIHWLICLEAFLPAAWIRMRPPVGSVVVIASNDQRTQPVPVAVARKKVARSMSRLRNVEVAMAENGRSAVGEQRPLKRPVVMLSPHE